MTAQAEVSAGLGGATDPHPPVSMDEGPPVSPEEATAGAVPGAPGGAQDAGTSQHSMSLGPTTRKGGSDSDGDPAAGQDTRDTAAAAVVTEYVHECVRQGLRVDAQLVPEAVDLFHKIKPALLANLDAAEFGRGQERIWGACVLYIAKRLRGAAAAPSGGGEDAAASSPCFTLTQLLHVTRLSVVDFFKEVAQFVAKVAPTLKTLFGGDCDKRLLIAEYHTNFCHLVVLFNYYKRVYQDYFLSSAAAAGGGGGGGDGRASRPGSKFSLHMEFGWMLFLVLRMRVLPQFSDLVTCTNGLLAVMSIMILHVPPSLRKASLEDTTKFGATRGAAAAGGGGGVDIVASLCHLYYASEKDVANMVAKASAMLQDVFHAHNDALSVVAVGGVQGSGFHAESGFLYFQGLMDDATVLHNLEVLESDYEKAYMSQGELDERAFLRDDDILTGAASMSVSGIKRKFDVMSSPYASRGGGSAAAAAGQSPMRSSPCSSPLKSEPVAVAANKMPPPTPVSTTMTTAKWFRTVIAPLPSEPSAELQQAFRSCDYDVTNDIRCRLHSLMGAIFPSNGTGSWRILGGPARGTALMDSIWAEQRSLEATKLYYKVLGAMCQAEARRQPASNLTALLTNERFHRCMIACSAELVLATHKTVTMTFPAVLSSTGITAFDLSKVIEGFVRYEETLPRELKRHLNSLEERLLESMAWERGSSMYSALLVAKPHLSAEINRLGLLPEPMPSLDLKFPGTSLGGGVSSGIGSVDNAAADVAGAPVSPPRLLVPSAGKCPSTITGSAEVPVVPGLRSPAVERASAFSAFTSPLKGGKVHPSLHSQFASPQRPGSLGGDETCAEIVIGVFFQKVLKLAANRIRSLCERLQLSTQVMEHVYSILKQILHSGTTVFFHRHIDQLILCSIYGVCKVSRVNVTFRDIIFHYRKQPQCKPNVFRNVFIDFPSARRTGKPGGGQETGDIIKFYNEVFVPTAKVFLLQISANGTCSLAASGNVDSSNKCDGKPSEASEPSAFPALPDMSPKKVSATHNVYVSPLRAMKMEFIMSPHTRSLYACVGESTHEYQSPSKDLSAINSRLNSSRRLDFGEIAAGRERDALGAGVAIGTEESNYPSTPQPASNVSHK